MKILMGLGVLGFAFMANAQAELPCTVGQIYPTSTGAPFECVAHPTFGAAMKAPDGTVWSATVPGLFDNLGPVTAGVVVDSPATRACAAIGGALPTTQDYERLQYSFEWSKPHWKGLSEQGLRDLFAVFPDSERDLYWASSAFPRDKRYASPFSFRVGAIVSFVPTTLELKVRCIDSGTPAPQVQVACTVGQTYSTRTGATFECVAHPTLGPSMKAPDGTLWSSARPNTYNHLGSVEDGTVVRSAAVNACRADGGSLPTLQDYRKLMSYFEYDGKRLSPGGEADFDAVFPDMKGRWFWMASVIGDTDYFAYAFYGTSGYAYFGYREFPQGSVRCVASSP